MKLTFALVITLFIIYLNLTEVFTVDKYRAYFNNLECYGRPLWFRNLSCSIKPVNRTTKVINFYAEPVRPLTKMFTDLKLFKRYASIWRNNLIHVEGSICAGFSGKNNRAMKVFRPLLKEYTNINHTCPYDHPLIAKDVHMDFLNFGFSLFPPGRYKWELFMYEENKSMSGSLKIHFVVEA